MWIYLALNPGVLQKYLQTAHMTNWSVKSIVPVIHVHDLFVTTCQASKRVLKHTPTIHLDSARAAKNNSYGCLSTPVIEHEEQVR